MKYNAEELSTRASPLPLDAPIRVSRLMLKAQKLPVRYNTGELSMRVSPLYLDAHKKVSRLMLKTKTLYAVQCRGALYESLTNAS